MSDDTNDISNEQYAKQCYQQMRDVEDEATFDISAYVVTAFAEAGD